MGRDAIALPGSRSNVLHACPLQCPHLYVAWSSGLMSSSKSARLVQAVVSWKATY